MPLTRLALRALESGLPDYKLAAAIQVPPSKFSNWTLGRAPLPTRAILRLCLLFECDPEDLIGWAEDGKDLVRIDERLQ